MARLAIKGHETRGKEVIQLLEMLGGNVDKKILSTANIGDILNPHVYFFDPDSSDNRIVWYYLLGLEEDGRASEMMFFTLEEFLEKYPYKVGDRVTYLADKLLETQVITNMRWDSNYDCVLYYLDNYNIIKVDDILYKIGSPEDNIPTIQDKTTVETIKGTFKPSEETLVKIDFTRELCIADEVEVILGDYEFVLKDGNTYFVKKKHQYPKTYDECCDILGIEDRENGYCGYEYELLGEFQKLYICRNAYWKIAGKEMGLDGPWKPDWGDTSIKYCLERDFDAINKNVSNHKGHTFAFPTAEMRNAFYEHFKGLIEDCKELL